jgi:hypothetical protein
MTVSDIRHQLVQAGVPTRMFTALSWGSTANMISLARILKGSGDLVARAEDLTLVCPLGSCVDEDLDIHFQPVHVHRILKSILKHVPGRFFRLGEVHQAMFPDATRRSNHTAVKDVLAFEDVIGEILLQTERLYAAQKAGAIV